MRVCVPDKLCDCDCVSDVERLPVPVCEGVNVPEPVVVQDGELVCDPVCDVDGDGVSETVRLGLCVADMVVDDDAVIVTVEVSVPLGLCDDEGVSDALAVIVCDWLGSCEGENTCESVEDCVEV